MSQEKILHNRIRCKKCGDVIESFSVHDFVWCSCGSCAVDGGHAYLKRAWDGKVSDQNDIFEEMSEVVYGNETKQYKRKQPCV